MFKLQFHFAERNRSKNANLAHRLYWAGEKLLLYRSYFNLMWLTSWCSKNQLSKNWSRPAIKKGEIVFEPQLFFCPHNLFFFQIVHMMRWKKPLLAFLKCVYSTPALIGLARSYDKYFLPALPKCSREKLWIHFSRKKFFFFILSIWVALSHF